MENVNLSELSDSELVKLSIDEKSNDAYSELVKRWMNAVKYSAYEITGNGDPAEDIAQEAFLVCWIKLHMLREYEKFGIWVCRTAGVPYGKKLCIKSYITLRCKLFA